MKLVQYITLVIAALVAFSSPSFAGSGKSEIRTLHATSDGMIVVNLHNHDNMPACNVADNGFAFDGSTAGGKNRYALLLAAATAKKLVGITGTGLCYGHSGREEILYLSVEF